VRYLDINQEELDNKILDWINLEAQSEIPFTIDYNFSSDREEKFARWVMMASSVHSEFKFSMNDEIAWHQPLKPLALSKIGLVTTAGVRLQKDNPYLTNCEETDSSFRTLSNDPNAQYQIDHLHYDHTAADLDINCIFPIEPLRQLKASGIIGSVAENHIGMMGCISNTSQLVNESIPKIVETLLRQQIDYVILTPG